MFHIAKSIYVETDNNLIPNYSGILVSKIFGKHVYLSDPGTEVVSYLSMEDMLKNFDNSIVAFWETVLSWNGKYVIYLPIANYLETIVVLLKRIFPKATPKELYFIYKCKLESEKISEETASYKIDEDKNISLNEFTRIFNDSSKLNYFWNLDLLDTSFEFLMLNIETPEIREELLSRFKYFIDDLFIRKILSLKESILRAGYLAYKLDPELSEKDEKVRDFLRKSDKTKWVFRNKYLTSADTFTEEYSKEFITEIYENMMSLEEFGDISKKIDEKVYRDSLLSTYGLIDSVYDGKYVDLFEEVISRGTTLTYLNNSFYNNINFVLLSWILHGPQAKDVEPFKFNLN